MSKYINEDQQLSHSHSQPQPPQQPPELGSLQTSMMEPLRILEPAESRIMVSLEAIELTSNFDDVSELQYVIINKSEDKKAVTA